MLVFQNSGSLFRFSCRDQWNAVLPEKVAAIEALEPPKDIEELRNFLGFVGFYRKLIPFFMDITVCLNTILWKGAVFTWTEQCGNTFKLGKSELVKCPCCNIQIPIGHLNCSLMCLNIVILGILHQEETLSKPGAEVNLIPIAYPTAVEHHPEGVLCGVPIHSKVCILFSRC